MKDRVAGVCLLAAALVGGAQLTGQRRYEIEEKQNLTRSFAAARRIEVDNIFGSIRVSGSSGSTVQVTVTETLRARTADDAAQARKDVKLDMGPQGDTLRLYVDGPFRCNCRDGGGGSGQRGRGYQVQYDFEIQVPQNTVLWLRTVNQGTIAVDGITGDFDIENVNGGLELKDLSGSGRAHTVNGPVRATFQRNPRGATSFGSINGELDLVFQPGLSADLRLKTFNGKIYSDFEMDALPGRPVAAERKDGKSVFRADRFSGVRIGSGGPEITLDGFNGDIRIRRKS